MIDLNTIWFILIAVLWIGFFLLEGFDFGVGMLSHFSAKMIPASGSSSIPLAHIGTETKSG